MKDLNPKAELIKKWFESIDYNYKSFIAKQCLYTVIGTSEVNNKVPISTLYEKLDDPSSTEKIIDGFTRTAHDLLNDQSNGDLMSLSEFCSRIKPKEFDETDMDQWASIPGKDIWEKAKSKYNSLLAIRNSWFELMDTHLT